MNRRLGVKNTCFTVKTWEFRLGSRDKNIPHHSKDIYAQVQLFSIVRVRDNQLAKKVWLFEISATLPNYISKQKNVPNWNRQAKLHWKSSISIKQRFSLSKDGNFHILPWEEFLLISWLVELQRYKAKWSSVRFRFDSPRWS